VTANTIKNTSRPIFPFTAIVGQEEMKLALALNVIDPKIGGVIIMGDRGTENQLLFEQSQIFCLK